MTGLRLGGRLVSVLVLVLVLTACGGDGGEQRQGGQGPARHTIRGVITEFEQDDLSVRADDGRQLIFWVGESPTPLEDLRAYFHQQTRLEITYESRSSRLVPISILVAPGEARSSPSP